jgi:hypothetical protein
VELVPFPVKIKVKVNGSGQECPLRTIYAIRGELPAANEAPMRLQGSFGCACGFAKRIRMLRSG